MSIDIKIPSVGESVQEAVLAEWFKKDGETIQKEEALLVIETDKVTLEVVAEAGGVLKILIQEGETVAIGAVVGQIETDGVTEKPAVPEPKPTPVSPPPEKKADPPDKAQAIPKPAWSGKEVPVQISTVDDISLSPSVRRLVAEKIWMCQKSPAPAPGIESAKGMCSFTWRRPPQAFLKK